MSIKHVTELYCSDIIKSIVGAPFSLVGTEGIHCTETWRAWVLTWGPFLHVIPPPSDPLSSDITQSVLSIKIFKKAPPKNYTQSVVDYFTDQMTSDFSLHHNMTFSPPIPSGGSPAPCSDHSPSQQEEESPHSAAYQTQGVPAAEEETGGSQVEEAQGGP